MANECWSELAVYGPRLPVLAFKYRASGPGTERFVSQVAGELEFLELVDNSVSIRRAARIVEDQRGYSISAPSRRTYSRWKKQILERVAREQKHYLSELRKALKSPNPLDLNRLFPVPAEIYAGGTQAILDWQADNWSTKWNSWFVEVEPLQTLPRGIARLQYSLMTAWSEPIGAVAHASSNHPLLCFVLAGLDADNPDFTSHLIRRGRVRTWRMPDKIWPKLAEMESDVPGGDEYLAGYQPRIMAALLEHWNKAALAEARRVARGGPARH